MNKRSVRAFSFGLCYRKIILSAVPYHFGCSKVLKMKKKNNNKLSIKLRLSPNLHFSPITNLEIESDKIGVWRYIRMAE